VVKVLDGFPLDRKIHTARWNFFFLASEVKVMFFGAIGATKIRETLIRISRKVKRHNFNCLEVTGIVTKRFLGVPYATVFTHSRPIQQSCQLDSSERRLNGRRDGEWARGRWRSNTRSGKNQFNAHQRHKVEYDYSLARRSRSVALLAWVWTGGGFSNSSEKKNRSAANVVVSSTLF
jgi:hypothetical protein